MKYKVGWLEANRKGHEHEIILFVLRADVMVQRYSNNQHHEQVTSIDFMINWTRNICKTPWNRTQASWPYSNLQSYTLSTALLGNWTWTTVWFIQSDEKCCSNTLYHKEFGSGISVVLVMKWEIFRRFIKLFEHWSCWLSNSKYISVRGSLYTTCLQVAH